MPEFRRPPRHRTLSGPWLSEKELETSRLLVMLSQQVDKASLGPEKRITMHLAKPKAQFKGAVQRLSPGTAEGHRSNLASTYSHEIVRQTIQRNLLQDRHRSSGWER